MKIDVWFAVTSQLGALAYNDKPQVRGKGLPDSVFAV